MTKINRKGYQKIIHVFSVFFLFSIIYAVFFSPVIFSERLLAPGDGIIQSIPAFYSPRTLWTDLILSGFPTAADPNVQTWYPLCILFSLIPHSWNAYVISAYVLASCFTYGYLYTITNSRLASIVSGIIYGMSGFMMAHLGHTAMIHTALWIPLLIWSLEKLRYKFTNKWFVVACSASTCCILAGHPQITVYGMGIALVYALLVGANAPIGRWIYYKVYIATVVLGIAISSIQIIPTIELMNLGQRSQLSFQDFNYCSLPLAESIRLLFPWFLGGGPFQNIPYSGVCEWGLTEVTGYVGILPLILATIGFLAYRYNFTAKFWLIAVFITFLLTLGDATFLARLMYNVPAYNKFRVPARHFIEMTLGVSVLAGYGIAAIEKKVFPRHFIFKILTISASIIIACLLGIYFFYVNIQDKVATPQTTINLFPWSNPQVGMPILIFLSVGCILVYWSKVAQSKVRQILLILILLIDLAHFGWFYDWQTGSPRQDLLTPTASSQKYQKILSNSKQRILPVRGGLGTRDEIPVNISRLWGVPSASGYGPLILSRVSKILSMGTPGDVSPTWPVPDDRSLDIMSVRYIFTPQSFTLINQPTKSSYPSTENYHYLSNNQRWNHIENINQATVYENLRAMPRAWLVPEVITLKPEEVLHAIKSSNLPNGKNYEPSKQALIEESVDFKVENFDSGSTIKIVKLDNTNIQIKTTSLSSTFLVLSDVNYPGWQAKIDGKLTHIFQTNYVLRGLLLSEGNHTIDFEFRSQSFYIGAGISTASLVLLVYLCLNIYTKKRL